MVFDLQSFQDPEMFLQNLKKKKKEPQKNKRKQTKKTPKNQNHKQTCTIAVSRYLGNSSLLSWKEAWYNYICVFLT